MIRVTAWKCEVVGSNFKVAVRMGIQSIKVPPLQQTGSQSLHNGAWGQESYPGVWAKSSPEGASEPASSWKHGCKKKKIIITIIWFVSLFILNKSNLFLQKHLWILNKISNIFKNTLTPIEAIMNYKDFFSKDTCLVGSQFSLENSLRFLF